MNEGVYFTWHCSALALKFWLCPMNKEERIFFNLPYCNKDLMTSIKNTRFQDDKQCYICILSYELLLRLFFFSLFACGGWCLLCFSLWRVHHIFIIVLVYYLTYFCSLLLTLLSEKKNLPSSSLVLTQCDIPKLRASKPLINFLSHQFFRITKLLYFIHWHLNCDWNESN